MNKAYDEALSQFRKLGDDTIMEYIDRLYKDNEHVFKSEKYIKYNGKVTSDDLKEIFRNDRNGPGGRAMEKSAFEVYARTNDTKYNKRLNDSRNAYYDAQRDYEFQIKQYVSKELSGKYSRPMEIEGKKTTMTIGEDACYDIQSKLYQKYR